MNNRYLITIEIEPKKNSDLFEEFRTKWQNKGFILKEEYAVTPISNNKFISNDVIAKHFKHIQDEIQKHLM